MTTIKITTDRLPQPDRRKGAIIDVTPEKAASLVAQGFAEIVKAAPAPQAAPEAIEPVAAAPAASEATPRRRRVGAAL